MQEWMELLSGDPLPWLLEPDPENPGVRYFTGRFDSGMSAVIGMFVGIVLYIRTKESQRKRE